jgi:hypothetical protein
MIVSDRDDCEKTCDLVSLLGCALLTALNAIDRAGELTPNSRFLDLTLVIGYYLELSHDLPAYGIEGSCVNWRKEAVVLFNRGKLDPKRGLFDTDCRLKELEHTPAVEPSDSDDETEDEADTELPHDQRDTEKDPWSWSATIEQYKKRYENSIGLRQHNIIKSTRVERRGASHKVKNALADIPVNHL